MNETSLSWQNTSRIQSKAEWLKGFLSKLRTVKSQVVRFKRENSKVLKRELRVNLAIKGCFLNLFIYVMGYGPICGMKG